MAIVDTTVVTPDYIKLALSRLDRLARDLATKGDSLHVIADAVATDLRRSVAAISHTTKQKTVNIQFGKTINTIHIPEGYAFDVSEPGVLRIVKQDE